MNTLATRRIMNMLRISDVSATPETNSASLIIISSKRTPWHNPKTSFPEAVNFANP